MTTTTPTARRAYYLRRVVHVAVAGAETALCGARLIGAIDTEADATCTDCAGHAFETTPGMWDHIEPINGGSDAAVTGLPESTDGAR